MSVQSDQLKERTMRFAVDVLRLIGRAEILKPEKVDAIRIEAVELRAIFARSVGTARQNVAKRPNQMTQ